MQAFKLAVGRSYRLVDRMDVVPALPPFDGYVHLDYSQWIQVSPCMLMPQPCASVQAQKRFDSALKPQCFIALS